MDEQWSFDQYQPPPPIERMINQQVRKLERHLRQFDPRTISLQGHLARPKRKQLYQFTLVLKLPESSLTVTEQGRQVKTLLRSGFDALLHEVKQYQGRQPQAGAGERTPDRAGREADPTVDRDIIDQYVPRLSQYVQREIDYYLTTGELAPDLVRVEDVVDEVVMRALTQGESRPPALAFDRWLITLASDVLDKQVQQVQVRREAAGREEERVEQRLSRVSPERAGSAIEDEMYDWYQPDEKLRVEDVLADPHSRSPEEIAADRQLQQDLDQTIAFLPKPWRDVFVLHTIEGFTLDEVSIVTGQTLDQVQQDLQAARQFLRERLSPTRAARRSAGQDRGGAG